MSDWSSVPATEKQLAYLRLFGYTPEGSLTKQQASDLLSDLEQDPEWCRVRDENRRRQADESFKEHLAKRRTHLAHYLHLGCDAAARESKSDLRDAKRERLNFWKDTFDLRERISENWQADDLHEQYGSHYKMPTAEQIQAILDALDKHSPTWDIDYPHAFYSTLQTNFPELVR